MGVLSSKPKNGVQTTTLKEKEDHQKFIKMMLYHPNCTFLDQTQIKLVLAIPLTDDHMKLTYEEVTLIIREKYPEEFGHVQARIFADIITQGRSLQDEKICKRSYISLFFCSTMVYLFDRNFFKVP